MSTETLHGWFSPTQAKSGYHVYRTPEGGEVKVTLVTRTLDRSSGGWTDLQYVGVVTTHARTVGTQPVYHAKKRSTYPRGPFE